MAQEDERMRECIEACSTCHDLCVDTTAQCLTHGGAHVEAPHLTLMLDCAEICQTSANFMLRGSALHAHVCAACAEICERCAEDCDRFMEPFMKRCAEECRRCAALCREMAGGRTRAAGRA